MNHYFDAEGRYTHSLPEGKGRMPRNARRVPLPVQPWGTAWPRWNGKAWEMLEAPQPQTSASAKTDAE